MIPKIETFAENKVHNSVGVVGVVYSTPDGGKSSLLLTLTKSYKVLYFDVEGLAIPIFDKIPEKNKDEKNLSIVSGLSDLKDIDKFLDSDEAKNYDVLVVDSVSYLVGLMTAKTNPANLKGNAVFGYYRDLGIDITLIMEKAKKKGINLFMTFQATSGQKGYENVWIPKVDGNEVPDRVRELSNLMVFIEKNGFNKRIIWQDTDASFAYTKSKALPADHAEKVKFEGMDNFTMDFLLGDLVMPKASEREGMLIKQYNKSLKGCKTIAALKNIWAVVTTSKLDKELSLVKVKDEMKIKLIEDDRKKRSQNGDIKRH